MFNSQKRFIQFSVSVLLVLFVHNPSYAERIDKGSQVIDGTKVFTTIYHERGYAIFENNCGKQKLTQSQLQGGAKPMKLIPCNPPGAPKKPNNNPTNKRRLWAAIATGIQENLVQSKVSAGFASDHQSEAEAKRAALKVCQKDVRSCKIVATWNSGCHYVTVSENAENVAWGSGPTAQAAYDNCFSRVRGGNCKTSTLGGCYSD